MIGEGDGDVRDGREIWRSPRDPFYIFKVQRTGTGEKREREPWTNRKWRGVKAVGLRGFPRRARTTKLSTCKSERRISRFLLSQGIYIYISSPLCITEEKKKEKKDKKADGPKCKKMENGTKFEFTRYECYPRINPRCFARLILIIHLTDCAHRLTMFRYFRKWLVGGLPFRRSVSLLHNTNDWWESALLSDLRFQ